MKDLDQWEQFLNTGRIEDYLAYRHGAQQEPEQSEEERLHAGTDQCYRDDIKS